MKLARFSKRQIEQFKDGIKTQFCIPLNPQPHMDNMNFWHYKDHLWREDELDFPESAIEDYSPYQIGDVLYIEDNGEIDTSPMAITDIDYPINVGTPSENVQGFIRIKEIWVCRLLNITEEDAIREGFSSGAYVVSGGPLGVEDDPETWTTREDFLGCWDLMIPEEWKDLLGTEGNPWVFVYNVENNISREDALMDESNLILHRGKRVDDGAWVYGGYYGDSKMSTIIEHLGAKSCNEGVILTGCYEVVPETVGRYVGVNDKNKRRIFEGDIIEGYSPHSDDRWRCVVEFLKGAFVCRYLEEENWRGDYQHFSSFIKEVRWTVVGNIFENKVDF